jgi:hypothetical protein
MSFADFEKKAHVAISELRGMKSAEISLVHHDDADGLCSGAIMKAALEREGFGVKAFCLRKFILRLLRMFMKAVAQRFFILTLAQPTLISYLKLIRVEI